MICLNSAGNLVRSEVGKKSESCQLTRLLHTGSADSLLAKLARHDLGFSEQNPSHVLSARTEGRERPRGERRRGLIQSNSFVRGPTDRVCIWNHGVSGRDFDGSVRQNEPPAMGRTLPTLRRAWPKDGPLAAICVQSVDVQCVLQFTLIHAAGCVLHRRTSRVIHRLKLFFVFAFFLTGTGSHRAEACWQNRDPD